MRLQRAIMLVCVGLSLGVGAQSSSLSAGEGPRQNRPAEPGESCQTPANPAWMPQEQWVWEHICVGKIADFNSAKDYGDKLDPKRREGWPANRIIRPGFLETILLYEPYRSALPHQGVRLNGAWITETF